MMTESVHSFLALSNTKDNGTVDLEYSVYHHQQDAATVAGGGVGLFTVSDNCRKPANDFESVAVKSPLYTPPFNSSSSAMKRDPGGIGFIDDVGGSVNGLMSCTESLGFESSDERRVEDQIENLNDIEELCSRKESKVCSKWKREHVKREVKKFPPPLSSLNQNGKPTFFLRPVRKDGKLELKEVRIGRPEMLRTSRQDGRLRLHLIWNEEENIEEQSDEEVEEEEVVKQERTPEIQEDVQEIVEKEMEKENNEEEKIEGKAEGRVEGWQIPASPGGGEGFWKCHEQVSHHQNHHQHGHPHHHDLHVWRQHCVTIR